MGTFSIGGNGTAEGLDPVLLQIIQAGAASSPYNVELFSSVREEDDGSRHQHGNAVDIVLIDPATGEAIPNYNGGGAAFGAYEGFARIARQQQMRIAPDRAGNFRWGGYFRQGGTDSMHFDFHPTGSMAYGSWDGGLNEAGQRHVARLGGGQIYSSRGITDVGHLGADENRWSGAAEAGGVPWLRRGSEGDDVRQLQRFLNSQGARLEEDGDFGPKTERAVRAFQTRRDIDVDGIVGPQTYGAVAGTAVSQRADDGRRFADAHPIFGRVINNWIQNQIDRTGGPGATSPETANQPTLPPPAAPEFRAIDPSQGPGVGPLAGGPAVAPIPTPRPEPTPLPGVGTQPQAGVPTPEMRAIPPNFMTPEAYRLSHPQPLSPAAQASRVVPPGPAAAVPPPAPPQAGAPMQAIEPGNGAPVPPNWQTPEAYRLSHPQPLAQPRAGFAPGPTPAPMQAVEPPQAGVPDPTEALIEQIIQSLTAGNGAPVPPNYMTPEAYRLSHPQPLAQPRPGYAPAPRR